MDEAAESKNSQIDHNLFGSIATTDQSRKIKKKK